jgi:hypothetical protein
MYFEGRELKPYGEPVKTADLIVGEVYFRVSYIDQDIVIPELLPLVFIGRDLSPEHQGLCFQDAESFLAGQRWDDGRDDADSAGGWIETETEGTYSSVYEFDKALDLLLACSLRRARWDRRIRPIEVPDDLK